MTDQAWRKLDSSFPSWNDGGHVELRDETGAVVVGFLAVVDEIFDGEDEYPEFELTLSDGRIVSIHDFVEYRKISK